MEDIKDEDNFFKSYNIIGETKYLNDSGTFDIPHRDFDEIMSGFGSGDKDERVAAKPVYRGIDIDPMPPYNIDIGIRGRDYMGRWWGWRPTFYFLF